MKTQHDESLLEQLQKGWHWIPGWEDQAEGESGRVVLFEREFNLSEAVQEAPLHISADTRYKLTIDGERVCVGPARGSERHWFYDTIALSPLAAGRHLIQIRVQRFFFGCPGAVSFARTRSPGLTIIGTVGGQDLALTHKDWRAREMKELRMPHKLPFDLFLHNFEYVSPSPQDRCSLEWVKPEKYKILRHYGVQTPWLLEPRMVPFAEESELSASAVRHAEGRISSEEWRRFFLSSKPVTLPPKSTFAVEVEFPVHSTAFWRLCADSEVASSIKVIYSEAYEKLPLRGERGGPSYTDHAYKHIRDDRTDAGLTGPWDLIRLKGKTTYEPFWWRTFRFIRFEIETGQGELKLESLTAKQTNYPFPDRASWSAEGGTARSDELWEVSFRTLRNCCFDGYSDCPFYEQLQYAADTRLQILFHYYLTGDDRLARQAISAFATSVHADGLVEARTPAHGSQMITGFALHWILIVVDHWEYFAEASFVRPLLALIDGVFDFFARHTTDRGLVEGLPKRYWSFVDWHDDWDATPDFDDPGVPVQGRKTGTFTFFTLFYAYTLRRALTLRAIRPGFGYDYEQRAAAAINGAREHCFNGEVFTDTVIGDMDASSTAKAGKGARGLSQHCQVFAVLTDALDPATAKAALTTALDERNNFTSCSYTFQHYLLRAAAKVGSYNSVSEQVWAPFRVMLSKNLTTWEETPNVSRSDCHAWASLPLYEFPAEVAGLTPAEPGWAKVHFAPRTDLYDRVDTRVAMGRWGKAKITWEADPGDQGKKRVVLELPVGRDVIVEVEGHTQLYPSTTWVELSL